MFIVSYVVVTVKARLIGFDRYLEEAAMDLGANEWTTFRKITLPLLAPAILSAALLGVRALDRRLRDHLLQRGLDDRRSRCSCGERRACPCHRRSTSIASAIFLVAVTFMVGNILIEKRRGRHLAEPAVPAPLAPREG